MFEILSYSFFSYALIAGILIAAISSILGVFITLRKEANITHSISNFLFLGITVSLFFQGNYYVYSILFAFLGSILVFFIEKTHHITKESTKEIIAQIGMASALFILGFIKNLTLDINNFLFGNILLVNSTDLLVLGTLCIGIFVLFIFFGKNFLSIIIHEEIAKSQGKKIHRYNLSFLFLLSIFIAISIKIFGILLVWAFLVIPTNTAKILASSMKQVFIYSGIFSSLAVIIGLFGSYILETSTGASIILVLIFFFFISLFSTKNSH